MPSRHPFLVVTLLLLAVAVLAGPLALQAAAGPAAKEAALLRSLETRRLKNVQFEDKSLKDVLKWIRVATGFNIVLKEHKLMQAGIEPAEISFTATLEDVSVKTLMSLLLAEEGLAVKVKGNVIYVTTKADAMGRPISRLYPISHITYTKIDFIAPDINLHPSGFVPANDFEPEMVVEDDPLNNGDAVGELLQELLLPDMWQEDGWAVRATDRYLVVRCPKAVHVHVQRTLAIIASLK